jgi:hypothetical protein
LTESVASSESSAGFSLYNCADLDELEGGLEVLVDRTVSAIRAIATIRHGYTMNDFRSSFGASDGNDFGGAVYSTTSTVRLSS